MVVGTSFQNGTATGLSGSCLACLLQRTIVLLSLMRGLASSRVDGVPAPTTSQPAGATLCVRTGSQPVLGLPLAFFPIPRYIRLLLQETESAVQLQLLESFGFVYGGFIYDSSMPGNPDRNVQKRTGQNTCPQHHESESRQNERQNQQRQLKDTLAIDNANYEPI